jgi:hypothetical protein
LAAEKIMNNGTTVNSELPAGAGTCPICDGMVSSNAAFCPRCGHPGAVAWALRTNVTDVHMSFWSMIVFMTKWALASIPAIFILVWIGGAIYVVLTMLASVGR